MKIIKVGETLLLYVQEVANDKNCKGLSLETDFDNPAQKLYKRLGWKTNETILHYMLKVKEII